MPDPTSLCFCLLLGALSACADQGLDTQDRPRGDFNSRQPPYTGTTPDLPPADRGTGTGSGGAAAAAPEPVTFLLVGSGLVAIALLRRHRQPKA